MSAAREGGEDLVLLDACCVINLFATGRAEEILGALPYRYAVARYVAEEEVLEIDTEAQAESAETDESVRMSLRSSIRVLVENGSLELLDVASPEEHRQLVRFAVHLDDGEAHTFALAFVRAARVATDDKKAIRVFREAWTASEGPRDDSDPCISTSELLFQWADAREIEDSDLARVVRAIARRASFLPPRNDPHAERWLKLLRVRSG